MFLAGWEDMRLGLFRMGQARWCVDVGPKRVGDGKGETAAQQSFGKRCVLRGIDRGSNLLHAVRSVVAGEIVCMRSCLVERNKNI